MNSDKDLEEQLAAANKRLERATKALAPKHNGGEMEEFQAAYTQVLELQRDLASSKNEEYAVPMDFPVQWSGGAPLPFLLRNDYRTFLTFYVRVDDPNWDGSYITLKEPGSGAVESLALVEFTSCKSAKLGSPNDEVFDGHPLYKKGLAGCTAQVVMNSRWLAELEKINSVHRCYDPAKWRRLHHYVFWFHDNTFECIAESFKLELHTMSMAELLELVCKRLLA